MSTFIRLILLNYLHYIFYLSTPFFSLEVHFINYIIHPKSQQLYISIIVILTLHFMIITASLLEWLHCIIIRLLLHEKIHTLVLEICYNFIMRIDTLYCKIITPEYFWRNPLLVSIVRLDEKIITLY